MNKKIYIISLILVGFILNIFFYLLSDNYRYFLQSLKYEDSNNYTVNDNFKIEILDLEKNKEIKNDKENNLFAGLSDNFGKKDDKIILKDDKVNSTISESKRDNISNEKIDEVKVEFLSSREKLKLTNIENEILSQFNNYNLKKVDLHPRLFDLTGEYPDEYFEYYGKDMNLYFFGNKLYSDLEDIFQVLTYELPFTVNEVNNFGTKSFYINLDSLFDDDYIRIVLEKSNRTFGIKMKKGLYEQIKNDLNIIFLKG